MPNVFSDHLNGDERQIKMSFNHSDEKGVFRVEILSKDIDGVLTLHRSRYLVE